MLPTPDSERVLILAPTEQDALFTAKILRDVNVDACTCRDMSELCDQVLAGASAALIAEEHLRADTMGRIGELLDRQPAWSDLPLLILLSSGEHSSRSLHQMQTLGNVTLVTRPIRIATFVSAIQAMLRDRRRQYAVRDLLNEREIAKAAAMRGERRLSMALKAAGMAAWEWSTEGAYWSESLYELLGINPHEPASIERLFDLVHPDDRDAFSKAWGEAIENNKTFDHEFRVIRPDGHLRWLVGVGEPVEGGVGKARGYVGLNWDITDQKKAELREQRATFVEHFLAEATLALSSSLDFSETLAKVTQLCVPAIADWAYVDLLDSLLDSVDETKSGGDVRRVNVACADPSLKMLAERVAHFPDRIDVLDHPTTQGLLIPEFTEEMLLKAAHNAEHERVLRALAPRSIIVVPLVARDTPFGALTLLSTTSGRPFGRRDLTLAEELARRASVAIDNARLYEAGKQASAAKSAFVANMSHEIRTPMTVVLGYADLLLAHEKDPQKLEFLNTIKLNGQFLLEIINDILDLSKIEAGKLEIDREPLSVRDLVEDIFSMMLIRAAEKDIEFTVEFSEEVPPYISSDAKRLRQILVNLIGNAIKFTQKGSVRLIVRYRDHAREPMMQFDVIDTGIGMTETQQRRLFQPFSQGDSSVTRSFGGSGLGLAISGRLAKMLGGEIVVSSKHQQGSTFSCTIAADRVDFAYLIDPEQREEFSLSDSPPVALPLACRVLVVDDRRDVQFLTRHLLTQSGAEVHTANDGIEALETVKKSLGKSRPFDLILLDMQMPRLDGYQTATRLRELGFRQPIIALTADAMQGDMNRCLANGCDSYLSKPINSVELLRMVASYTRATNAE